MNPSSRTMKMHTKGCRGPEIINVGQTLSPPGKGAFAQFVLLANGQPKTRDKAPDGQHYCKPANDKRGCPQNTADSSKTEQQCPRKASHKCDIMLVGGNPCNKNHSRKQHFRELMGHDLK